MKGRIERRGLRVIPPRGDVFDHHEVALAGPAEALGPAEVVTRQDRGPVLRPQTQQGVGGFRGGRTFPLGVRGGEVFQNKRPRGEVEPLADAAPIDSPLQPDEVDHQTANGVRLRERHFVEVDFLAPAHPERADVVASCQDEAVELIQILVDDLGILDGDRDRGRPEREPDEQSEIIAQGLAGLAGEEPGEVRVEQSRGVVHVQADLIADAVFEEPPQLVQIHAVGFEFLNLLRFQTQSVKHRTDSDPRRGGDFIRRGQRDDLPAGDGDQARELRGLDSR